MTSQEDILLSLIQKNAGNKFASDQTGWIRGTDVCSWFGVTCDASGHVIAISLTGYSLQATLPSDLSGLVDLENLLLVNCDLKGTIPDSVAQMQSLREVDFSLNQLSGALPLFTSPRLNAILLAHNKLSGMIPSIGKYGSGDLITIDLKDNQLSGTIPGYSRPYPSLRHIDLSQNRLEGPAFDMFTQQSMPSLERLYLSDNRLLGTISPLLADSLQELHCQHNQLTGTIPATFATLSELQILLVHDNRFVGEIPQAICDMQLNDEYFIFGSNSHKQGKDGLIRRRRLDTLVHGDERDGCSSIACPAGTYSESGLYPCKPCGDAAMNPYLGATACNNFTQEEILDIFYEATNGDQWNDQTWNDEDVGVCSMTGIKCDPDGSIVGLSLRGLGLSGTLPPELGFLPNLANMDVSHNLISGHIPEELALAPLQTLTLSENSLSGYVPESLCQKAGVNGNGVDGVFDCDYVACRMGTHHPEGHATPEKPCKPCPIIDSLALANADCGASSQASSQLHSTELLPEWGIIALVVSIGLMFVVLGWWVLRRFETGRCGKDNQRPPKLLKTSVNGFDENVAELHQGEGSASLNSLA